MKMIRHSIIYHILIGITFLYIGCSKSGTNPNAESDPYNALAEGWASFESGNFSEAIDHFIFAQQQNTNSAEANSGLGWSYFKTDSILKSQSAFENGILKDNSVVDIHAGLAIIYNFLNLYNVSNEKVTIVLNAEADWSFAHATDINYLDLHLISAENYFNLRNYANSLEQVRYINSIFFCDLTTQEGILTLETEINRLKLTL